MQQTIKFDISIPLHIGAKLKKIKDKSFYDHNYYELPTYGDWVHYGKENNNILYQKYHELENCYSYSFGRFEDGRFVPVFGYATEENAIDGIEIE